MVPDHGRRIEPDGPAPLLELPADVDIVARHAEARVIAADVRETVPPKGGIAAWDVLGQLVREQDVYRSPRSVRNTAGDRAVARRGDVRATDPRVVGAQVRRREVI